MDDQKFDKPFLSLDDQIILLRKRNLIIKNDRLAKEILSNISYYTLVNGYNKNLCEFEDTFISDVAIEDLRMLYLLDIEINSIIMKYILYIERSFKTKLSNHIAGKFGVWSCCDNDKVNIPGDYLYEKNYSNSNNSRLNTLVKIKDSLISPRKHSTSFHYKTTKNHVPPWVLVNDISFSKSIFWYRILKELDKNIIVGEMLGAMTTSLTQREINETFITCLKFINEYRNLIAHGNRTFSSMISTSLPIKYLNKLYNSIIVSEDEHSKGIGSNDLYALLIAFSILINDKTIYNALILDIENIEHKFSNILVGDKNILTILDIPNDIVNRMKNLFNLKENKIK